jgi:hypothetical protein
VAHWHGFKQYAVDLGLKVRRNLGISASQRLDVIALATYYKVPILSFDKIGCPLEALHHFTVSRWSKVSGYLLPVDGQLVIIYNPTHPKQRIRATISHEIAHLILNHEFRVLATGDDGCIFGDKDQEDEAGWLGAELLLPREAAKRAVINGDSLSQLSDQFDVSIELARWRTNICGARKILQRARR